MSSVTAIKMRVKRNKQKRLRKKAKQKVKIGCRYCKYGLCAANADAAYCSIKKKVVTVKKNCVDFSLSKRK